MRKQTQNLRVKPAPRVTAKKVQLRPIPECDQNKRLYVTIPTELYDEAMPLLEKRGLTFSDFVRAQLRQVPVRMRVYSLQTPLQIGKYRGEILETIIRMNPSYVSWMLDNVSVFKIDNSAHELLDKIQHPECFESYSGPA